MDLWDVQVQALLNDYFLKTRGGGLQAPLPTLGAHWAHPVCWWHHHCLCRAVVAG